MRDQTLTILIGSGEPVTLKNYMELEYPDRDFSKHPAEIEEIVSMPDWLWDKGLLLECGETVGLAEALCIQALESLGVRDVDVSAVPEISTRGDILGFAEQNGICITHFEKVWRKYTGCDFHNVKA